MTAPMTAAAAVAGLRQQVIRQVAHLLPAGKPYALVDFPNYPNVGDSAIWLGQLACLHALGRPAPRYVSDFGSHDDRELRRRIGNGAILLTGGGSFGDLWPTGQAFREAILQQFRDNPIVQLPQTLHFHERASLDRARRIVNAHPDFTLLVRDRRSLELARNEFRATSLLCPDMAFCLGPLERPLQPVEPVLWLSRTDRESAFDPLPDAGRRADWLQGDASMLRALTWRLGPLSRNLRIGRFARPLLVRAYGPLAHRRLRRGLELLACARAIITDRLHGHILALLLGIPHVLLDNTYGKLSAFHATWTSSITGVHMAKSAEAAWNLARELADAAAAAPSPVARG